MATRERMSRADAAWLRMDRPTNLMIINGVLLFDEPVDWARFREVVSERLIDRYPRFRQRVVEPGGLRAGARIGPRRRSSRPAVAAPRRSR